MSRGPGGEACVKGGLGVGRVGGHHKEESSQRDEQEKGSMCLNVFLP